MEQFACRTMVISGNDALQALAEGKGKRLAVVTDPFLVRGGTVRQVTEAARCPEILVMDGVYPQPTLSQAVESARQLRDFRPDRVIALGGTNVLDFAKAIRCFARVGGTLTAIPTQVGMWEVVCSSAALFHDSRRQALQDETMRPDQVILDRGMLEAASRGDLCEGGFSLLAANVESYCGKRKGILTGLHAREAFAMAWAALPAAVGGSPQSRERILAASVLGGLAQEYGGEGLCGALCDSLESVFHLSQGKLAAIVLPAVMGWNVHGASHAYAELARAAGMGSSSNAVGAGNLRAGILRLRRELGLPGTLAKAGVDPRGVWNHAGRIVQLTLEDPRCRNNPVTVDDFVVRRILEEITGRY